MRLFAVIGAAGLAVATGFTVLPAWRGSGGQLHMSTTATKPVSVDVLSPRKAVVTVPPANRLVSRLKYYKEDSPGVFNQLVVSVQGQAQLKNLEPACTYVLQVEGVEPDSEEAQEVRFSMPKGEGNDQGESTPLSLLEMRVGHCLEVSKHPDADSLYVEKVDLGEAEPRTIVSGLVAYVKEEDLQGRMVVALCNLPPRTMRGIESTGMLLCSSNEGHTSVEPLSPAEGARVGELITLDGVASSPAPPGTRAGRAWARAAEAMKVGQDGRAMWQHLPLETSAGPCTSSIPGAIR